MLLGGLHRAHLAHALDGEQHTPHVVFEDAARHVVEPGDVEYDARDPVGRQARRGDAAGGVGQGGGEGGGKRRGVGHDSRAHRPTPQRMTLFFREHPPIMAA